MERLGLEKTAPRIWEVIDLSVRQHSIHVQQEELDLPSAREELFSSHNNQEVRSKKPEARRFEQKGADMGTQLQPARTFRDLVVWQKAHQFVLAVYRLTAVFPKQETYGLVSQLRRAAVSIPANIAEGCGKLTDADFTRFLSNAMGSASELQYELILSHDLRYLDDESSRQLGFQVEEVKRILTGLIKQTKSRS